MNIEPSGSSLSRPFGGAGGSLRASILLINQCADSDEPLRQLLVHEGHGVGAVDSAQEARGLMRARQFDLTLIRCHSVAAAQACLRQIKDQDPCMTVILMLRSSTAIMPYEASRAGADGLVKRPFRVNKIRQAVVEGLKMHECKVKADAVSVLRAPKRTMAVQ